MPTPVLSYLTEEERARLAALHWKDKEAKRLRNRAAYLSREGRRPPSQEAWDRANKDKMATYHREYSARWYAQRKEAINTKNQAWREANPERNAANNSHWKKTNKGKVASYTAKRRAQERLAVPAWTNEEAVQNVYEEAARLGLEVDHIVPLVSKIVCGLHCPANFQLLPKRQNASKSNRFWPDMP
jgi:hypothetical protein